MSRTKENRVVPNGIHALTCAVLGFVDEDAGPSEDRPHLQLQEE